MDDGVTHVEQIIHPPTNGGTNPCRLEISKNPSSQREILSFASLSEAGEYLERHSKIDRRLL